MKISLMLQTVTSKHIHAGFKRKRNSVEFYDDLLVQRIIKLKLDYNRRIKEYVVSFPKQHIKKRWIKHIL